MAYNRQPYDYQKYGVGRKIYGGGRAYPNAGPVRDKLGYKERDAKNRTKRSALLRRMKAGQKGKYMSADWLRNK